MSIDYYWKDGTPAVTAEMGTPEWIEQMRAVEAKHRDRSYSRVARTEIGSGVFVSTVWLGLDHNYWGGPPYIFETMLCPSMEDCERSSTEEEAKACHERMVAKWLKERNW